MTAIKSVVADAKRIVIKVGTALLTDNGRGLDEKAIANLAEELSAVQKLGREVRSPPLLIPKWFRVRLLLH